MREGSRTRVAVAAALDAAADAGGRTESVDLREAEVPPRSAAQEPGPTVDRLRETVGRADGLILGTPNYHGSVSGGLKTALDWCRREELAGTTVGLLEVAGGAFPGSALGHLRTISRTLGAWTLPTQVAIPRSHETVDDEGITDADLAARTRRLGDELVAYAGVDRYPELAPQRREADPARGDPA